MPLMQASKTFKIDRNKFVHPGDEYYCSENVARHHEAMGYATRAAVPNVAPPGLLVDATDQLPLTRIGQRPT